MTERLQDHTSIREVRRRLDSGEPPDLQDGQRWRTSDAPEDILNDALSRPLNVREVTLLSCLLDLKSPDGRLRTSARQCITTMEAQNASDESKGRSGAPVYHPKLQSMLDMTPEQRKRKLDEIFERIKAREAAKNG